MIDDPATIDLLLVSQYVCPLASHGVACLGLTRFHYHLRCSFHLDHCASLPYFMEKVHIYNIHPPTRVCNCSDHVSFNVVYVQGTCVHDPPHEGHLQDAAHRFRQSEARHHAQILSPLSGYQPPVMRLTIVVVVAVMLVVEWMGGFG
jgi:hypothetical protein